MKNLFTLLLSFFAFAYVQANLVITAEVCGPTDASTELRLTGPFWSWNPTGGPVAVNNGDGTFTFTLSPAPTADMEYLFVLDGVQEDMVASGTASGNWGCTPVTDFANYANRQWLTTDPLTLSGLVYGSCDPCQTSPPTAGVSPYCGVQTYHFQNPAELASSVYLTIANNGPNSIYVEVESADSDPVDLLIINSATPGYTLGTVTNTGGVYRNDMTWSTQVDSVDINVLWSKQSFGGNWQLSTTNVRVAVTDTCSSAPPSTDLVITTEVCGPTDASTELRITGPFWSWNPTGGPVAVNNGDGTFTFTLSPAPTADMEYLFVLDGVQEDMVASGTASGNWGCTPVTDFANYANRQWLTTDPLTLSGLVYGSCDPCTPPSTDLVITTEVCGPTDASTELRLTGPFWSWNPTGGPVAVNNGDGTFTFTLSPAPTADMEYLFVLDGVQEDMVASGTASGNWGCTPVTDFANYANRQWLTTDPLTLSGLVYGSCDPCQTSPPTAGVSPYCGVQTYHFQNPAELASSVYLTIANNGPNSIYVEVESADSDPVDLLIINSATPGYTLGTVTNTGGVYRNDMTWSTQVDSVDINVLWSKQSFGGNWQLSTTNVRVAVTDTCSSAPPSTDLVITTEVCGPTDASTELRITGPFWSWNPTGGPVAVNNGDGTFTFTLSPAPTADMEYLFVLDGVQEDMVASGTASGNWGCTPVTDFANYANRQWLTTDPLTLSGLVYGSCDPCSGTNPCLGVLPDTMILDDFECQKNINYTFANATWNSVTANPNPSGINTSANVGQFIHWGVGTDGAFGGDLDLAPIDLAVYGYQFKMDLHPSASGLPVTVVLQDGSGSDILAQTASTTVANEWETLSYDFSAVTTPVSKIVFVVAPGDTVQHEVYFDNIRLDTSAFVSPCAGIVPDTSVFDDFECQTNVSYTFANATWTEGVINPNPSGINTSSRVGEFIHWGAGTDGAFGGDLNLAPIDLVYYGVELNMDVHPSAIGLPITVVLQDAGGADIDVQTVTTTVTGEWETLTYDFGSVSDVASKVVFVVAPGDSTQHVVYFDNIKLDPSTALATCPGVAPDVNIVEDFDCQRNADYTAVDGSVAVIANPDASGINTSANVGEYTRGNGSDDEITVDFELAPLDFNASNQMKMDVWDADIPSTIEITLLDNAGIVLTTASATTSVGNAWEQLNFDFQDVPPTSNVSKAILSFDAGSLVDSNKVYYFDNWKMDGLISGIRGANVGNIALYPNPAKDQITLDLTKLSSSEELQVQFIAVDGRVVAESSYSDFASKETIDVSSLSTGIYIVEMRTAEAKWLTKFIKE